MDGRGSDAVSTLRWGLARYAWLFLLYVVLLAALLPAVASRASDSYDAEALVVAQRLDMALVALPRYGEAVFDNGEVARAIAAQFGDERDLEDIVPQRVSLVAEQDSIVLRVVGHDPQPDTAADLANVAAAAFLNELNSPGEGVGAFTVQSQAVPPSEPVDALPSLRFLIPVGLLAGGALGLAAVAVVLVMRRPVLEASDAEQATGVPVLANVTLPRTRRGEMPSAADVLGVVPFCRSLLGLGSDAVVLVSTPRAGVARRQLGVATASVLDRVCDLRFVAPPPMRRAKELLASREAADGASDGFEDRDAAGAGALVGRRPALTLVDSTDPLELVVTTDSVTTVLLVPHGMSLRALRAAAAEHLGGGPSALVMVRRSRRRADVVVNPDQDPAAGTAEEQSSRAAAQGSAAVPPAALPAER